jgi:hypothetical protein
MLKLAVTMTAKVSDHCSVKKVVNIINDGRVLACFQSAG